VKEETMKTRLTDLRKEILGVVDKAEKPLSTKMIEMRIKSTPNLSTIYRALDFLETKKFIRSVSFSGVKFYFSNKEGNGHFLFCKECHEILEFADCVVANLQKKIQKQYDYKITDHVLYFQGLCPECQNYLNKKAKAMS
jgi:Fur family ferric uptake transcriptional regulator